MTVYNKYTCIQRGYGLPMLLYSLYAYFVSEILSNTIMKRIKLFLLAILACVSFVGCTEEKPMDEVAVSTEAIAGNYVGTLKILGYTDEPQRAYVTLTRRSSDVVAFEVSCENFQIDLDAYNLVVTESKGVVTLNSESGYSISGSITNDILTVTFQISTETFLFTGKKD